MIETIESVNGVTGPVTATRGDDGVWTVSFDRVDSSANVFDSKTLRALGECLDEIESDRNARGVVFTSAKPGIFVAGADVHEIVSLETEEALARYVDLGQTTIDRVARLAPTTVAAIHGACLGGGCELALACDWRIATSDPGTRVGLPEVMLGIVPAWGGSTRLPRLIGVPAALGLILAGKRLPAKKAKRVGLVDLVVPHGVLDAAARSCLSRELPRRKSRFAVNNRLVASIARRLAAKDALSRSRGHYPALPAAIEVAGRAPQRSIEGSLAAERSAVLRLAEGEEARNLIGVFLLQERAKRRVAPPIMPAADPAAAAPIASAAVVGAGVMGAGIAQWLAAKKRRVVLRDVATEPLLKGLASIGRIFHGAQKRGLMTPIDVRDGMERISPTSEETPLDNVDLVVEAAVEKLDVKQAIFKRLEAAAGERTILATNTSALSIDEIANAVSDPGRVVGLHFFNPVHRMQLVEIVVGARTSPETCARVLRLTQEIGKLPVVVKDRPGFLVNRILMPYLVEAGSLFASGHAPLEIDAAMLDFGMPMGPIRLLDEVGLDVAHHVARFLGEVYGDRMPVPQVLLELAESGDAGRKSGKGFYLHERKKKSGGAPEPNPAALALRTDAGANAHSRQAMQRRMVLVMLNEAARCLEEEIVSAPEDVDLGMVMGTGFAPFRGGPLRYADSLGAERLVAELREWADRGEDRFVPCALLNDMAKSGSKFYRE